MKRPHCPRCNQRLYSDDGRPFCWHCGTLREWPDPAAYRDDPRTPSGRPRRNVATAPRGGRPWTAAEDAFVRQHLAEMSLEELGAALGRTQKAVQTHLDLVLGIPKPYIRRNAGELVQ